MNLGKQRRIVRAGAIFVLVMVLLPNIAYVGHWSPFGETTHAHSLHHEQADTQDHAAHCHEGPASCAGAQSTVGTWWVGDDPNPIAAVDPVKDPGAEQEHSETEGPAYRIVHPPRFA